MLMDYGRFANAVAAQAASPAGRPRKWPSRYRSMPVLTRLSFGGTTDWRLGEAVIFFPQGDGVVAETAARDFPFVRKSSGHLLSKHRLVSGAACARSKTVHGTGTQRTPTRWGGARGAARLAISGTCALPGGCEQRVSATHLRAARALPLARGHGYYPFDRPELEHVPAHVFVRHTRTGRRCSLLEDLKAVAASGSTRS